MVEICCHHCQYRWDYRGESEYYATCPRCYYKVKVPTLPEDKTEKEIAEGVEAKR